MSLLLGCMGNWLHRWVNGWVLGGLNGRLVKVGM